MKKLNNKKGFTLAELLIVVAIVAVLVAISIPIFNGKLKKAKIATDQANVRAAKAAAVAQYLTEETHAQNPEYFYDAENGKLVDNAEALKNVNGYNKLTKNDTDAIKQIPTAEYKNAVAADKYALKVIVKDAGKTDDGVSVEWVAAKQPEQQTAQQN